MDNNIELIHDDHFWHLRIYNHTIWVTEDDLRDIVRVVNNGLTKKDMWSKEFIENAALDFADSMVKRNDPEWLLIAAAYKAGEEFIIKNMQKE